MAQHAEEPRRAAVMRCVEPIRAIKTETASRVDLIHRKVRCGLSCTRVHDLTAARTNEVIQARWSEFDPDLKTWVVPAERMESKRTLRDKTEAAHRRGVPGRETRPANADWARYCSKPALPETVVSIRQGTGWTTLAEADVGWFQPTH